MASLPELIGLLYRADWTRLSLSAELRSETNGEPPPRRPHERWSGWYRSWPGQRQDTGRWVARGELLIGAGGRWRLEYPVPGQGAEAESDREAAEGSDGEHGWAWRPPETGGPPPLPVELNGVCPPVPELFCPSGLLGGYTLEELGPVTVAGRDAIAVAATPRGDVIGSGSGPRSYDRVEVAVDAELGILLRRTETSGGELVTLTELTAVTMNPPVAADPARFAAPAGSHRGETREEIPPASAGGPGRAAADLAADGLGALIRNFPHRAGHARTDEHPEAMPTPDPAPLEPAGGSPPPDEVLDLLYRSGGPRDLGATARQWHDLAAIASELHEGFRNAGSDGFASLFDAMTSGMKVTRTEARLRVSGPDRYRLDFSARPRPIDATTIASDGERRWRVYRDRTLVGPAAPLREEIVALADSSWLLRTRLSGGAELIYRGRPARQLRATAISELELSLGSAMIFPADAIVDAETGGLLRLLCYSGGTLAVWSELDDISTEPADPGEFRVQVPPGTRVVEETGNPIADAVAGIPGVKGTAARAAAEAASRTAGAVSAARSFLDDLRSHR
ncbi:MAG: hypothetical protein JO016_13150 [Actinobacteria bacterium]|nr:hypothetical protein [Actinomycetota bacterium]